MMEIKSLKRLDEFLAESAEHLQAFQALETRSPHTREGAAFAMRIRRWLRKCVTHGRYLPNGSPERRALRALVDEWNSRLSDAGHLLDGLDELANFDPTAGVVLDTECPYPGLDAYRQDRQDSFEGRDQLSERYARRLESRRVLLVIGPSGSGKSSLALAGVRPELQRLHSDWFFPPEFTPGAAPIESLAQAVAAGQATTTAAVALATALASQPDEARSIIAATCGSRPMLLVVDQFEELFTLCADESQRATFARVLLALTEAPAASGGLECRVLLTLRSDHLARFDNNNATRPLYARLVSEGNSELITTLTFDEIRRAIARPAQAIGLRFVPPTIVDSLASQTAGLANGLPLLQFALRRLWDTRPRDPDTGQPLDLITQPMVDALPDVQRALGTVAEEIFRQLSDRQKAICERLLNELVLLDENFEEPLRRRRRCGELMTVLESRFPDAGADIEEVERRFVAAGLLRSFGSEPRRQIEVAHEALFRHWDFMNRAVSGDEAKQRLHMIKQIGREALEWHGHGRREDFLKQRGEPLQAARRYLDEGWLAESESATYVRACIERDKFLAAAIRSKERQKWLATSALVLGLVALFVTGALVSAVYLGGREGNTRLAAIASLGDRQPSWDALDVAYSLASSGSDEYLFALGHAVERMDDAWILGRRDSPLHPLGDGAGLMQFTRDGLLVYLVDEQATPTAPGIAIATTTKDERLTQVQLGPRIAAGPLRGSHLLVVASLPPGQRRFYRIRPYLLDPATGTARAVEAAVARAGEAGDALPQAEENLSRMRVHPDGSRVVWTAFNERAATSRIHELRLLDDGRYAIGLLEDPATVGGTKAGAATAVAYLTPGEPASGGDGLAPVPATAAVPGVPPVPTLVTGRQNGAIYCGDRRLAVQSRRRQEAVEREDTTPVRNIVSAPAADVFVAVKSPGGQVLAGSCGEDGGAGGGLRSFPFFSPDAGSLQLRQVRAGGDDDSQQEWIVSYFDADRQQRCHTFDPDSRRIRWWQCNGAHAIGRSALITTDGDQLVIERSDIAAVRRYPIEELARNGKQVIARQAGESTLRWRSRGEAAGGKAGDPDAPPWQAEGANLHAIATREILDAALSPDGKRLAWIERAAAPATRTDEDGARQAPPLPRIGTMVRGGDVAEYRLASQEGIAQAVAINDDGIVAAVQAPAGQSGLDNSKLLKLSSGAAPIDIPATDGGVRCLAFSPDGERLVWGTTSGALSRWAWQVPGAKPQRLAREGIVDGASRRAVTACAIADDGDVAAGYADGAVLHFAFDAEAARSDAQPAPGGATDLTARLVYRFQSAIKDVRIDPPGEPRRLVALGDWQLNNCVHAGLPGQAVRAWSLTLPEQQRSIAISVACFPNTAIAALGPWQSDARCQTSGGDDASLASSASASPFTSLASSGSSHAGALAGRVGICLVTAQGSRWHPCPACGDGNESRHAVLERALATAAAKGARRLDDEDLESRFGFKLYFWSRILPPGDFWRRCMPDYAFRQPAPAASQQDR